MSWIKENQSKIVLASVILIAVFAAIYLRPQSEANTETLQIEPEEVDQISPELDECLKKVQKKVDYVTADLNEWFADPESNNYDNSTVWDDVAALAQKDREKCRTEFDK